MYLSYEFVRVLSKDGLYITTYQNHFQPFVQDRVSDELYYMELDQLDDVKRQFSKLAAVNILKRSKQSIVNKQVPISVTLLTKEESAHSSWTTQEQDRLRTIARISEK